MPLKSSTLTPLRQFFELINNIPETVKYILSFVKPLISYVMFRVYRTEEMMIKAESAMAACSMEKSIIEQQVLILRYAVIVNGVQDPGFTPFEEFLPRSAPKIGSSVILHICQISDITRRTLSALKAQIRVEQRLLKMKRSLKGANMKKSD